MLDRADVLRRAGVTVIEHPGWQTRGQNDGGYNPRGLMLHHDGSPFGDSPGALEWMLNQFGYLEDGVIKGRHGGAQDWIDYYGHWHIIAAGRCWHAGIGPGWGPFPPDDGNTYAYAIETDHTEGEPWRPAQLSALRRGVPALFVRYGWDPLRALCGHKEYAPGRKPDPDPMDMNAFRADIKQLMINPEEYVMASREEVQADMRRIVDDRLDWFLSRMFNPLLTGGGNAAFDTANPDTVGDLRYLKTANITSILDRRADETDAKIDTLTAKVNTIQTGDVDIPALVAQLAPAVADLLAERLAS